MPLPLGLETARDRKGAGPGGRAQVSKRVEVSMLLSVLGTHKGPLRLASFLTHWTKERDEGQDPRSGNLIAQSGGFRELWRTQAKVRDSIELIGTRPKGQDLWGSGGSLGNHCLKPDVRRLSCPQSQC